MNAEKFFKSKGIKQLKRVVDGKETGEYVVTPALMDEYLEVNKTELLLEFCSNLGVNHGIIIYDVRNKINKFLK